MKWYHHIVVFVIMLAVVAYSDRRGFNRGVVATTTALEPYLCEGAK